MRRSINGDKVMFALRSEGRDRKKGSARLVED